MKVRPKKALGQHFLTDQGVARRIAATVDCEPYEHLPVLEVGPGMGVLTAHLLDMGREVTAVELDSESVAYLKEEFPRLPVVEGDFLRMDIGTLFEGDFVLTGNYPYNISSQIFFRLLDYYDRIPLCTGMLQREVAERICAPAGSRTRGILSVLLQVWYDCEYLFTVSEGVFNPPPKVKSGVLRLKRNSRKEEPCDMRLFKTVVKTAFGQRRKTLRNSLRPLIDKDSDVLRSELMDARPEALTVDDFIALTLRISASRPQIAP